MILTCTLYYAQNFDIKQIEHLNTKGKQCIIQQKTSAYKCFAYEFIVPKLIEIKGFVS
jgi:hypothetical protein